MQTYPLLQTKLHTPPVRAEWVTRPRLLERLNAGLGQNRDAGCKLTLISAPAGFCPGNGDRPSIECRHRGGLLEKNRTLQSRS